MGVPYMSSRPLLAGDRVEEDRPAREVELFVPER
jgi:hypothetical protein